jgi:hypothetical protein
VIENLAIEFSLLLVVEFELGSCSLSRWEWAGVRVDIPLTARSSAFRIYTLTRPRSSATLSHRERVFSGSLSLWERAGVRV